MSKVQNTENYLPIEEGRTHINIYSKSTIALGRSLSNFAHTPFTCPDFGHFQSLEGYWYYVTLVLQAAGPHRNAWERLRNEVGLHAKQSGKALLQAEEACGFTSISEDKFFRNYILEATRCKLRQNHDLRRKLGESRLPLTHYYYYGSIENPKIVLLPQHQWQIDEILRCRTLLQTKKERKSE